MVRGAFIAFEGLDRSGKTTQCKLLKENLRSSGYRCELLTFPDGSTEIGCILKKYLSKKVQLNDQVVHLLFSANRWEAFSKINFLLEKGINVLVDRYAYSGVAYTAAKTGIDFNWCKSSDEGLPKPDIVFFFRTSMSLLKKRFGNQRYETEQFQNAVLEQYLAIQDDSYWKEINANLSIDDVHTNIVQCSKTIIKSVEKKPILFLWNTDMTG